MALRDPPRVSDCAALAVRDLASEMLAVQAARESLPGYSFGEDTAWQREFEGAKPKRKHQGLWTVVAIGIVLLFAWFFLKGFQ